MEEVEEKGKFMLYDEDFYIGEMSYERISDGLISIEHTKIKKEFGGKGYARKLLREAVSYARQNNLKIRPVCPFVLSNFNKDESFKDVRE